MVRNEMKRTLPVEDALRLRRQADDLLERLRETRAAAEARIEESGRPDPIKAVTGTSALDQAIRTTRSMIKHMDELMHQMDAELADAGSESLTV